VQTAVAWNNANKAAMFASRLHGNDTTLHRLRQNYTLNTIKHTYDTIPAGAETSRDIPSFTTSTKKCFI